MHYYGFNGIKYKVDQIWKQTSHNKIVTLEIDKLKSMLDVKPWKDEDNNSIGPKDILDNITKYKNHSKRIQKCDLKYPIIISFDNIIVDGYHRFTKSCLLNEKTINIKYVSPNQLHYTMFENKKKRCPKFLYYSCVDDYDDIINHNIICHCFDWLALFYGLDILDNELTIGFYHEGNECVPMIKEIRKNSLFEACQKCSNKLNIYIIEGGSDFKMINDNSYSTPNNVKIFKKLTVDPFIVLNQFL
jgi:hypothetical protein